MSIQPPSEPSSSPQSTVPTARGTSSAVENLRAALSAVRRRRSLLAFLQQSSIAVIGIVAVVLILSLAGLWLPDAFVLQLGLFIALAALVAVLLWRYIHSLYRLRADDQQLARFVESRMPDLEQRLLTSLEFSNDAETAKRAGVSAQFVEQLWIDAEDHLRDQHRQLEQVSDSRTPMLSLSVAGVAALVTVVAFISSESLLRAGAHLLWPFSLRPVVVETPSADVPTEAVDLVITVEPGDIRMQRGRSAGINVRIENGVPENVRMRMQSDQLNWYDVSMREEGAGSSGAAYSYYMPEVTDDLVYYISIDDPASPEGEQRTRQFSISLYDLPYAEQIDLAYTFPDYTGMENTAEADGGDMVVPEGTTVAMSVTFNKAVQQAEIVFDDNTRLPLAVDGVAGSATLTVDRDTGYQIVATDFDRLETEDADIFYIRSIPDQPPELALRSPGRDQDVMPLEEVILEVAASDDYGLSEFMLHYSVVGTDEQAIDFLPQEQTREITGNQMIYMEDLLVQPGDFVSYYMTLADNNGLRGPQQIASDIYFLQVVPTDQEFRRAGGGQQGGGGGGGGGDNSSSALVTLQKDIIAATWRLRQQQLTMDQQQFTDDVGVLAESQREAKERANMSIQRLSERLDFADDSYGNAVTYLQSAIEQMELAAVELDGQALTTAMKPEQQALQLVLRAEAEINRTDVNFQRQAGGGGGGGGQQENEDLRELFEMEMGQNENRYETPRQAGGGQQQNTEESSRLEELARRQESLTRAQRNLARRMDDMEEEQRRRELERLQREQEQLSTELAQLQQQMNRRQQLQQNSQQNSQQASGQTGASQSNSQMQRALEQMQEAAQADSPAQAAARSQRALESLREQQRQMAQQPENSANQLAQNLSQRGQQLIEQQRALQQQLQQLSQQQGLGQTRQASSESDDVQDLVQQQERNRQELAEIERMLRAVIARAGNEEQQLLSQAQQANRAMRNISEQMDTANRVLRNGMVNLAVDIEGEVADSLQQLGQNLQALGNGGQTQGQASEDPVMQAAADASALRQELERLQQEIDARQAGEQGDASIADMREQLARSQQLAQQLAEQLDQAGQAAGQQTGQRGQRGQQAGQPAQQGQQSGQGQEQSQGQQGQPGQGQQRSGSTDGGQLAGGPQDFRQQQQGRGGIPAPGEAALWGNARSISSEITQQSLEDFMSQPELLRGLLQPLIELESDLRARAELAQISRRLFTVSEEDIPDQYRQLVESYYRALSETGAESSAAQPESQAPVQ